QKPCEAVTAGGGSEGSVLFLCCCGRGGRAAPGVWCGGRACRPARRRAIAAMQKIWREGQAEASVSFTRRTETVTLAPILRSFWRIVPQVAFESCVTASPVRRGREPSTEAKHTN